MPFSADQFVDSVGVNTRLSYTDWPTATNWFNPDPQQNIRSLLTDLGVRHLRDRIPFPSQRAVGYANPRLASLYLESGIKFTVGIEAIKEKVLDESGVVPFVNWYANGEILAESGRQIYVRDMLDAIEGPNEYDKHHHPERRETDWANNLNSYQKKVYRAIKENPQLSSVPVIMPALIHTAYCNTPLDSFETSADLGNLHSYPNYPYMRSPTAGLGWHLKHVTNCSGQLPIWVTETGYFTVSNDPAKISETTAAKYTSRLLAEYFRRGRIKRTFLHEIANSSIDGWGLIAAKPIQMSFNGQQQFDLRPKPAYYAVKSLLQLLSEATWSKTTREWLSPSVSLNPVNLSLQGNKESTQHLLLQKSNGHYYLLLWQEVESYKPKQGNFDVDPNTITVDLPSKYRPVSLYQYDENFTLIKTSLEGKGNSLDLAVPDSVMVLEFTD